MEYKIGDKVNIVSASYGGDYTIGKVGVITNIDGNTDIIMSIPELDYHGYVYKITDIAPIDNKIPVTAIPNSATATKVTIELRRLRSNIATMYKNKLSRSLGDISRLEGEIRKIHTIARDTNTLLNSFRQRDTIPIKQELVDIVLDKYYTQIEVRDAVIEAKTKPVVIVYEGIKCNLGVYTIQINCITQEIYIDGNPNKINGYIHPHVSNNVPCLGTYAPKITKQCTEQDYLGVLDTLGDFINSVYEDGWYTSVLCWAEDVDKRCHECLELTSDCSCDLCSECGQITADCECDRCPDSGDLIQNRDEYCENCSSYDNGACHY